MSTDAPADIARLASLHRVRVTSARLAAVTILAALYAFYVEHRRYGDLTGEVEGGRVRMTCTCGAVINRMAEERT